MRKRKTLILFLLGILTLTGCGKNSSSEDAVSSSDVVSSSETSSEETSVSVSEAERYTITFYSEGGTSVNPITAEAGAAITKPDNPVRQGYTFVDWFEDKGTWEVAFVFDFMPERDVVLYAKWQAQTLDEIEAYNNSLAASSKPNHLYIHYLRFNNTAEEYNNWDIWVWPDRHTGRMFDFVKEDGVIKTDNYGGAMIEVDLGNIYTDGGHDGNGNKTDETVNFSPNEKLVDKIGFLITYKPSRSQGTHWTSDGGDKFLLTKDALEYALNGSLHIFAVQENTRNFTYRYGGEVYDNPYEYDDGNSLSAKYNDVDSSGTPDAVSATSPLMKNKGVGYQIMVGSFADSDGDGFGDIRGITLSLDYLESLNVEAIWLTPVQISDSYHGYDTIDYYNIDPKFGSKTSPHAIDGEITQESANADYLELLSAARERNIAVVMDLVINHTSINNLLFQESLSLNPEYRAYYHWRNFKENSNWYQYSNYEYYYYGKFASSMPELNFDYQKTRDKIVDIMSHWVNAGVNGFRIDAVKHAYMKEEVATAAGDKIIKDTDALTGQDYSSNLTKNLHLFKEINARLKEINPNVFIIGENFDGHAYHVAPYYEGLDSMLNFYMYYNLSQATSMGGINDFHHYNKAAIVSGANTGGSDTFSEAGLSYGGKWNYNDTYKAYNLYRSEGAHTSGSAVDSLFTSNHDVTRAINQAIGWLNSAGEITGPGDVTLSNKTLVEKQAIAYMSGIMLLPGLSWIYYGDELGLASNLPTGMTLQDPNIDRIFRQPMKWDKNGSDNRTTAYSFTGAQTYDVAWDEYNTVLDGVSEQNLDPNSMLSRMKKLTALKSATNALKYGSYAPLPLSQYAGNNNVFAFKRELGGETYNVYINLRNGGLTSLNLPGTVILSLEGATKNTLPAWSVLVTKI